MNSRVLSKLHITSSSPRGGDGLAFGHRKQTDHPVARRPDQHGDVRQQRVTRQRGRAGSRGFHIGLGDVTRGDGFLHGASASGAFLEERLVSRQPQLERGEVPSPPQ